MTAGTGTIIAPSHTKRRTRTMPSLRNIFLALTPLLSPRSDSAVGVVVVVESFSVVSVNSSPRTIASSSSSSVPSVIAETRRSDVSLFMSEAALPMPLDDEDDEMEWIEEEFELLAESDFYNTEWKIGTIMENKPREASSIDTTWVRLVTTENGDNKAIWGDNSQGKWTIDVPSQFFSISKETFGGWFGKQIWAGTVDDFYYLDGTVRGWSPISPASVEGQWQGVRLGVVEGDRVSVEERGEAPWFTAAESEDEVGLAESVAEEEVGEDAEEEAAIESVAQDENVEEEEEAAIESEAEEEEVGEDAEEEEAAIESETEEEEVGEYAEEKSDAVESEAEVEEVGEDAEETSDAVESEAEEEEVGENVEEEAAVESKAEKEKAEETSDAVE